MKQYVKDAKTHEEPWDLWECKTERMNEYETLCFEPSWSANVKYRRKKPKCHPDYKSMKQYVKDAKNHERPWELWECKEESMNEYKPLCIQPSWHPGNKYRRKKSLEQPDVEQPS